MKTPEDIAQQIADTLHEHGTIQYVGGEGIPTDAEVYRKIAEHAIQLDREQRAADLAILADAAAEWSAYLTQYAGDHTAEDRASMEEERDEIQAALGRYLDEQEAQS